MDNKIKDESLEVRYYAVLEEVQFAMEKDIEGVNIEAFKKYRDILEDAREDGEDFFYRLNNAIECLEEVIYKHETEGAMPQEELEIEFESSIDYLREI